MISEKRHASVGSLDRREFILGAAACSATFAKRLSLVRSSTVGIDPPFAALHSLPPGAVKAQGWLALYLEKQANQLGLHLPEVSWPFSGNYWSGEEKAASWWPWEQKAYWTDGALRCALLTENQQLMTAALAPIDFTLQHQAPNGFLGPAYLEKAEGHGNFRWPHAVFFRALAAKGEAGDGRSIAEALRKHYLSDHAPYGGSSRDVTNVEAMLWSYVRCGDGRLLEMAKKAWSDFLASSEPGCREAGDLHPDRVFARTPIHSHGVTYIEKAKLPAILYTHTGNREYLEFALAAQDRIFEHHMLIDGIPTTSEDYGERTPLDAHETCDISDHMWTWGYLLMATGDGVWGDRIERACFNAGFGAIKKDWKALQYFSSPNQVLATRHSCHVKVTYGRQQMAFQPNPNNEVACCAGNVHRFFPNYVLRMWMRDQQGGIAAAFYGASTVNAEVGPARQRITIRQETDYPFSEEVHFTIETNRPVRFPFSLRIPAWCGKPALFVNDKPVPMPPIHRGFVCLNRTFLSGDRVTLVLPMTVAVSYWSDYGFGLERGPLVYALPIKANWESFDEERWSTKEFPGWNATPSEPWNYGIGVVEGQLLKQVRFERRKVTADPWQDPPVTLFAPLSEFPGWKIQTDEGDPKIQLTPPLPGRVDWNLKPKPEPIALVPYGSTHLRISVFPETILGG